MFTWEIRLLEEIRDQKKQLEIASELLKKCPGFANFYDLFVKRVSESTASYRVFKTTVPSLTLGFFSSEGHLNLYGSDGLADFWQAWLKRPEALQMTAVFGLDEVGDLIESSSLSHLKVSRQFRWGLFTLDSQVKKAASNIELREFREDEQDLIDRWYADFNKDQDSQWISPNLADHGSAGLFAAFNSDGKYVGAVASPLPGPERFWVGRLYVFHEFRRQGYAKKIMMSLITIAEEQKKSVCLQLKPSNSAAKSLYISLGFKEKARLIASFFDSRG